MSEYYFEEWCPNGNAIIVDNWCLIDWLPYDMAKVNDMMWYCADVANEAILKASNNG